MTCLRMAPIGSYQVRYYGERSLLDHDDNVYFLASQPIVTHDISNKHSLYKTYLEMSERKRPHQTGIVLSLCGFVETRLVEATPYMPGTFSFFLFLLGAILRWCAQSS